MKTLKKTITALTLAAAAFAAPLTATAADYHDHDRDHRDHRDDRTPRYEQPRYEQPRYDDRGRNDGPRYNEGREAPRRGDLVRLGSVTAQGREGLDRDVIEVRDHGRYTALVFRVDRGDAVIEDVKVTFENDQTASPNIGRVFFREGSRSQRIDLPGYDRDIKRVRFLYRSAHGERVTIEVFGVMP